MLLAVDAGNTNVVFALLEAGAIRARWRIATDPRRTGDEYAVSLNQLLMLEGLGRDAIDAVIVGTVVPQVAVPAGPSVRAARSFRRAWSTKPKRCNKWPYVAWITFSTYSG